MIVAEGMSKYYGERRALDDLSFEIADGEVVGFLGLNGAGKTTALKILSGLLLPSAGRVCIDGVDQSLAAASARRHVGFLPDRPALYEEMTVRAQLRYAGQLYGVSAADIDARVDAVLELANLGGVQHDLIAWLSHGYRQRVGIAQAIVHAPKLVILDEPISGLDPEQIVGMRALIRSLAEQHTVLLSSHILGEISQTCDRILVLNQGRIVARGTEEELVAGLRGTRTEVIVRGDAQVIHDVIRDMSQLKGARTEPFTGEEDALWRVEFEAGDPANTEALVARLVAAGGAVRRVADLESPLETVFLRLTSAGPQARPEGEDA